MVQTEQVETFPYLEWRPDIAAFPSPRKSPFMVTATNVLPSADGYGPAPDLNPFSDALPTSDVARGGAAFLDKSGQPHTFVGSPTALYKLASDGSWTDVTRVAGGAYTLGDEERWTLSQFGDNVIASHIGDAQQIFDMTASTEFEDIAGSPAQSRFTASFGSQLVAFNTTTSEAHAIASRVNDIDAWDGDGTGGSWEITFPDGGPINAAFEVGGAMWFGQATKWRHIVFVGDEAVIDQEVMAVNSGVDVPLSFIPYRGVAFYVGGDGLYQFNPLAGGPTNIGVDKVDNFFTDEFNRAQRHLVSSSIDPLRKLWLLAFPSSSAVSGRPDRIMAYYWPNGTWAILAIEVEHLMAAYSLGIAWDDLDDIYASIDDVNRPFDSPLFVGGAPLVGAMTTGEAFGTFDGSNLAATLESGDYQFGRDNAATIKKVTPLIDCTDPTQVSIEIGFRNFLGEAVSYSAAAALNSEGEAFPLRYARYPRMRTTVAAGATWTKVRGIETIWASGGKR